MATPDGDLAARVAVLEREVARLREQAVLTTSDAGAARVLAAGAEHDVSEVRAELRAHTQALNALRETQLEQGQRMSDGFTTLNAGMTQIVALLATITDAD